MPSEEQPPELLHDHALVISVVAPERVPRLRQLKHILRYLTPTETKTFLAAGIVALAALSIAGGRFVLNRIVTVPIVGGTFTEAVVGEPIHLNPLDAPTNDVDRDLTRLIYSGLFRFEGTEIVADLVESYAWSDDRKTLTLHLRKDARFHDGVTVTSDDVRFTLENAQDPARKSPLFGTFRGITITIPDETTVVLQLEHPDAQLLGKLTVGILPAHLWQDAPTANARLSDLNIKPIGSGPFRVKSFLRDNLGVIHSYTLERADGYYGTKPYLKTVIFEFFADQRSAIEALKADLVDATAFIESDDVEKLRASGRKRDVKIALPQTTIAFLNMKDKTLSLRDVRQALDLAVHRQEIIDAQDGSAEMITGPYPFGAVSTTTPDLERARNLLTAAGWVLPSDGNVRIWSPPKKESPTTKKKTAATPESTQPIATSSTELALTISYPDGTKLAAVAESLKRAWSLLGVRVTLEPLATEDLLRRATRERTTQVVLSNILLGPEQDLLPFWWSGQATDRGLNISNLKDRNVDDMLEATRDATTTEALFAARERVSRAILASTPAVFLTRPVQHYLISTKVKGLVDSIVATTPSERLQNIGSWYEKTGWRWK